MIDRYPRVIENDINTVYIQTKSWVRGLTEKIEKLEKRVSELEEGKK